MPCNFTLPRRVPNRNSVVFRSENQDGRRKERALMAEGFPQTVPASPSPSPISKDGGLKQTQVSGFPSFPTFPNSDMQTFPIMCPTLLPRFPLQNHDQMNRGAGIYAVPTFPYMGPVTGLPYNTLIPFTYNTPTSSASSQRPTTQAGVVREEHGQAGEEQHHQPQPHPPQRQVVVRRFHIAIQLDLFLILKLAAVIFLFNQDGSRQRLVVLVFFASLIYFYQTGALAPLIRWLSQGMHRAPVPPNPPRRAVRPENVPPVARQENDNATVAEGEGGPENRPVNEGAEAVENENAAENGGGNHLRGVLRELQMIVFGFITSLLPGFHNID